MTTVGYKAYTYSLNRQDESEVLDQMIDHVSYIKPKLSKRLVIPQIVDSPLIFHSVFRSSLYLYIRRSAYLFTWSYVDH